MKKIAENIWELPKEKGMNVPGKIFASDVLMKKIEQDRTLEQVKNVASLPGIVLHSMAMPDAHQGYGFPIGGVAAFDMNKGVISPGGVGYDINCGVRLISTGIPTEEFMLRRKEIMKSIYEHVPSGVGEDSEFLLTPQELDEALENGLAWAVKKGYATVQDKKLCEDEGCIVGANAEKVSIRAKSRGKKQLGTIGSGNHFIEVQDVESIFDDKTARVLGLSKGTVVIMIHTGSRGLGHQVASDYIHAMEEKYGFSHLPDRELACAPINSPLGKDYQAAMAAAANFAFLNRQIITHQLRTCFSQFFPKKTLSLVYDIAHNIAKFETYTLNGKKQMLCVHRKGATRSFGPGRKELPVKYRKIGQPIFLPGSMGTYSYVLLGTDKARNISFASTPHGAGRVLSRSHALKHLTVEGVEKKLKQRDVMIVAGSKKGIVEEAPEVYKDVNEVARVSDALGIAQLVARLRPLGVIKG